jgi:flagellum-specific peptidoglycan hydrolase FlgJ
MCGVVLIAYVLIHKDLNLQLNLNGTTSNTYHASALPFGESPTPNAMNTSYAQVEEVSVESTESTRKRKKEKTTFPSQKNKDHNLANTYSNMTYSFGKNESSKSKTSKRKKQEAYVNRFVDVAQKEMMKYGIPASITLAQGLIETNAGDSRLARQNNNHFGMKCFSKKCGKGHCANFTDDSHKDFFRKYKSSWESYRAHSKLLMGKRYRHLKKLGSEDYNGWARGLKKAGYATDKRYAEKLINIIDELKLYRFDNE